MASDRAAITLHGKKQGRQMARYRFNKKVRSNNRNKYENIDIRKVEKKKLVTELKTNAKKAKKIWLASDEDREGHEPDN